MIYAVRTTRIACRLGCPSRPPNPRNVEYFDDFASAARAGYRACKRCAPDSDDPSQQRRDAIERACALLAQSEPPSLEDVAAQLGFSRFHFQRMFRAVTGMTPAAYRRAINERHAREFAGDLRRERLQYACADSPLGRVLVALSERGVAAIELGDDDAEVLAHLRRHFPKAAIERGGPQIDRTLRAVVELIGNPGADVHLALDVRGTAFQQRIWNALRRIPVGSRLTYGELAAAAGSPRAAQAAGAACAANRLAVAIPCHRAVGRDGELAGYRWGIERKAALLAEEERRCLNSSSGKQGRESSSTTQAERSSTIRAS